MSAPTRPVIDNRGAFYRGYRAARHFHDDVRRRDEARFRFVRKYGAEQVEVWDRGWAQSAEAGNSQMEYR